MVGEVFHAVQEYLLVYLAEEVLAGPGGQALGLFGSHRVQVLGELGDELLGELHAFADRQLFARGPGRLLVLAQIILNQAVNDVGIVGIIQKLGRHAGVKTILHFPQDFLGPDVTDHFVIEYLGHAIRVFECPVSQVNGSSPGGGFDARPCPPKVIRQGLRIQLGVMGVVNSLGGIGIRVPTDSLPGLHQAFSLAFDFRAETAGFNAQNCGLLKVV